MCDQNERETNVVSFLFPFFFVANGNAVNSKVAPLHECESMLAERIVERTSWVTIKGNEKPGEKKMESVVKRPRRRRARLMDVMKFDVSSMDAIEWIGVNQTEEKRDWRMGAGHRVCLSRWPERAHNILPFAIKTEHIDWFSFDFVYLLNAFFWVVPFRFLTVIVNRNAWNLFKMSFPKRIERLTRLILLRFATKWEIFPLTFPIGKCGQNNFNYHSDGQIFPASRYDHRLCRIQRTLRFLIGIFARVHSCTIPGRRCSALMRRCKNIREMKNSISKSLQIPDFYRNNLRFLLCSETKRPTWDCWQSHNYVVLWCTEKMTNTEELTTFDEHKKTQSMHVARNTT